MKFLLASLRFNMTVAGVAWGVIAMGLTGCASAEGSPEIWKTSFTCGEKAFTLESHCRASGRPFELNQCLPDQRLSDGVRALHVPSAAPAGAAARLFAVGWGCAQAHGRHFITLSYASGQGRSEEDELSEVFTLDLHPVTDRPTQVEVFRNEDKGVHGRVRSILPDGEVSP